MSILSSLASRFRTDASYLVPDGIGNTRNKPPTFVPKLIRQDITDPENLEHLEQVAMYDPVANYITDQIATLALDDWFEFQDDDGNVIMEDVLKEMQLLGYKKYLIQLLKYERRYGYSYGYKGQNTYIPKVTEGGRLASLHAFTPIECVVKKYDGKGDPVTLEVTVSVGESEYNTAEHTILLPAEDFTFLNTRPIGRGYTGESSLHSSWDMLTYLRYLIHSMAWYDMKIGNGMMAVITKSGIPDDWVAKLQSSFEDVSIKRAWVADGAKVDDVKWVGATSSATDFGEHIDVCLNMIAAATGIPKDVLVGATAGVISGSEVNVKSLYSLLNQVQASMVSTIRKDVQDMGFEQYTDYNIVFNTRYAMDEEQQSKIDFAAAQTWDFKLKWMTINEVRAENGLPPREDGDRLASDLSIGVTGLQGSQDPEERENTENTLGENT